MPRFLLPPEHWGEPPALTGDESRHLTQVLRIKPGETITVFDGCGRRAEARVLTASRDWVQLDLGEIHTPAPPLPTITLAQAIPKGKNMDLIVQKAVELGIARIQPLVTRNTVVQPSGGKSEKWRRTALEACKQCGQDSLPEIAEPLTPGHWLAGLDEGCGDLRLIASLAPGALPFRDVLREHPRITAAILLVGPEGDFTPEETQAALGSGFIPISLGDIVLRVETATLYCLSALKYEFSR